MIEWIKIVDSQAISAIGYDAEVSVLGIKFTSGEKEYIYTGVPKSIHEGFLNAPSHGTYYRQYIKDKYLPN